MTLLELMAPLFRLFDRETPFDREICRKYLSSEDENEESDEDEL